MARVTYVKRAQQRYETVPVLDPATGLPKTVAVTRKDGTPKTTKRGKEIVRTLTVDDKSKPLPNRNCDKCGTEIKVGDPYKWIAPKSGPYGGYKRFRCNDCPSWQVWEYSSSTSARIAELQHNAADIVSGADNWETEDDATSAASEIAEMIRELATEKEEAADNIVEGFGHETYQSEEIREVADGLNGWADEVEGVDFPEFPEVDEEVECEQCGGDGKLDADVKYFVLSNLGESLDEEGFISEAEAKVNLKAYIAQHDADPDDWFIEESDGEEDCKDCEGTGSVDNPEEGPSDEALEDWRNEAQSALDDAVGNCPV